MNPKFPLFAGLLFSVICWFGASAVYSQSCDAGNIKFSSSPSINGTTLTVSVNKCDGSNASGIWNTLDENRVGCNSNCRYTAIA